MSSSSTRVAVQGPTLPPIRTLHQSPESLGQPTMNRLPPLRRPMQGSHRSSSSLGTPASADYYSSLHRDLAISMAAQEGLPRSLEKAFNVYNERLRADLRDFRGLCTTLVAQEQQEAMKWYSLCLKVMKERDMARQQLRQLSLERNSGSSPLPPPPVDQDQDFGKASKRGREDAMLSNNLETASASSRSNSIEPRPIKPLRFSPVHSPMASPTQSASSPPPFAYTPSTTPSSSSMLSPTSPLPEPQNQADARPGKRRKSIEAFGLAAAASSPRVKEQSRTPSPLSFPGPLKSLPSHPSAPSADFSHVDLMYVPMKGKLVCRACILQKSKNPSVEPSEFPTSASWDELRQHCLKAHPDACADVARLCPAEIFELRRRLSI